MRIPISILLSLFISTFNFAQKVEVLDNTNLQPLADVYIYCGGQSVSTNTLGYAEIGIFSKTDSILFLRQSYKKIVTSYSELKEAGFKIQMIESAISLPVFVVTSDKWEQSKLEVPVKIITIDQKHISFENPQTAADLLSISEEVFVQKSQLGGGSPMIRGFSANRLLLVVDGVRMNNAIYRSGNLQNVISLDAAAIENTEVIFGPGSVIYGSDALGGVMDFHTLKPKLSVANVSEYSGSAWMRYASANQERSTHFDLNFGRCRFASVTSFTMSEYDDLMMGNVGFEEYTRKEYVHQVSDSDHVFKNANRNRQVQTAYSQMNFMQKFRFRPNEYSDWIYAFHYSQTSDVPRYDRLTQYNSDSNLKYAEWSYGPQVWMMNSLTYVNKKQRKWTDKMKFIFARQDYKESRHSRKIWDENRYNRFEEVIVYTLNFDNEKKLKEDSYIFYGIDGSYNSISSSATIYNTKTAALNDYASRYPDGSQYLSLAVYGNYKKNISKKLTFVTGMRYSRVFIYSIFDTSFYSFPFKDITINTGAFNASAGLVWHPDESWQINTSLASGFRAPNIDDIGKVFDSEPGAVVVPNPDLKPEYAINLDLGAEKSFGEFLQIEATTFATYLLDAMVRRDFLFDGLDSIVYDGEMSQVQALVNTGSAYVYGFHIGVNADISTPIIIKASLTYTRGMEKDEKSGDYVPLRHAAPTFASVHFVYQIQRFRADLYGRYNAMISHKDLSPIEISKSYMYATDAHGDPYSPAWGTLNFKAMYQINSHIQINAGIENITNLRYRPYSSGIVAPGRNFILALKGSF
ncbi:MAG: TonB-dependent receptor [Bacteroidetes bacterium]|jgi:hemoglobin/transferrin/lactoferrin receptor protein|nr:TonB-dependent receptor [Bacteroidota bacterium]MBT5528065.1 TonB-dependent receptor [Cytophagia bacterium]MBT3424335.1 TonB-dependent receptor [Bacteroidota bacterium]MBT3801918.1 TonB-dependent receptor [Bacteroidota bacterium]MBT4337123.1 TonB-dependent receptor [Bacteroidota bacterium]